MKGRKTNNKDRVELVTLREGKRKHEETNKREKGKGEKLPLHYLQPGNKGCIHQFITSRHDLDSPLAHKKNYELSKPLLMTLSFVHQWVFWPEGDSFSILLASIISKYNLQSLQILILSENFTELCESPRTSTLSIKYNV